MMGALNRLSSRDRALVLLGGTALLVFVLWLAVWRPMGAAGERMTRQIEAQSIDLEWMRAALWEARRLQSDAPKATLERGNQSLLALAEETARGAGLAGAFRRGEPAGEGRVRIWLEGASFDRMVLWLQDVERTHAVSLEDGSLDRAGVPGLVNARLLLAEH